VKAARTLGYIEVTKEAVYERYPDLDITITMHIARWRDSVKVGTVVPIADMMNFETPGHHNMPVEAVLDHVFPESGKCWVEGVRGIAMQLSPQEIEAGWAPLRFIQRTA
jgi:hypothetical protein